LIQKRIGVPGFVFDAHTKMEVPRFEHPPDRGFFFEKRNPQAETLFVFAVSPG
jgi:hypothetical protein